MSLHVWGTICVKTPCVKNACLMYMKIHLKGALLRPLISVSRLVKRELDLVKHETGLVKCSGRFSKA